MRSKLKFVGILCASYLGLSVAVRAEDAYKPPSSPELFNPEPKGPPQAPVDSHFFGGLAFDFGQSRVTGKGQAGSAYLFGAELGYVKNVGLWSRLEPSFELYSGKLSATDVNLTLPYGFIVKLGYGYSLGERLKGVLRAGVGLTTADYKFDDGTTAYKSKTTELGNLYQLAYDVVLPVEGSRLELVGGVSITQMSFSIGKVKKDDGSVFGLNHTVVLNAALARLGVRFAF